MKLNNPTDDQKLLLDEYNRLLCERFGNEPGSQTEEQTKVRDDRLLWLYQKLGLKYADIG